jgi:hypothetical protein
MGKPTDFATIPAIDLKTEIYTQRRTDTEAPMNYRFTVEELAEFLSMTFGLVAIFGEYRDDVEAASDAVPIGGAYSLTIDNYYGLPEGTIKLRTS